jgi:hypothetical protein
MLFGKMDKHIVYKKFCDTMNRIQNIDTVEVETPKCAMPPKMFPLSSVHISGYKRLYISQNIFRESSLFISPIRMSDPTKPRAPKLHARARSAAC